jgi:DNA-binding NtrC family response regulator
MFAKPGTRASILIVDDEKIVRESLRRALKNEQRLYFTASARQALNRFQQHAIDLVLLDILLPDMSGIDLLKKLKQIAPATRVIILTAVQEIDAAVAAMKAGAYDFLPKPFALDHVNALVQKALAPKTERLPMDGGRLVEPMAAAQNPIPMIYKIIDAIAPCDGNVLIQGARGTAKKLLARALHGHSTRAAGPYGVINCASRPTGIWGEGDLRTDGGKLNTDVIDGPPSIGALHNGSLFLDNIDYLALDDQTRLLHLIQHQEFVYPGSQRFIPADVRIITATNQNLQALVEARLFNADLYKRLKELPVCLPLLQAKGDDIGLLLEHFLKQIALRKGTPRKHFSLVSRATLTTCDWPGNVREFEHLVERLCKPHNASTTMAVDHRQPPRQDHPETAEGFELKKAIRAFERQHILAVLKSVNGRRSQAARRLGIHRNTLRLKTKELEIDFP